MIHLKFPLLHGTRSCVGFCKHGKHLRLTLKENLSLFVTNTLDGSEVYLVSDRLFALIGNEMADFRKELLSQNSVKI